MQVSFEADEMLPFSPPVVLISIIQSKFICILLLEELVRASQTSLQAILYRGNLTDNQGHGSGTDWLRRMRYVGI
jgi:hypothetical protein